MSVLEDIAGGALILVGGAMSFSGAPMVGVPLALGGLGFLHKGLSSGSTTAPQQSPAQNPTQSSRPSLPQSLSGDSGLAADAAQADSQRLSVMASVLDELKQNQVSVTTVQAEAAAAQQEITDLAKEIDDEITALGAQPPPTPAQTQAIQTVLNANLTQLQNIYSQQNAIATGLAQAANQAASQYAGVNPNNSDNPTSSSDPSSPTSPIDPANSSDPSNPTSPIDPANSINPYLTYTGTSPYSLASNMSPYSSASGMTSPDSSAEMMSSMLPEMMMPAMMIPSMVSGLGGMGARQPAPQEAQLASDDKPMDGNPKAHDVNASNVGDSGTSEQKRPGGDAATQPASAQSVGNSAAVPAGPNTDVKLPDGTTVHAPNVQAATAVRASLNGVSASDAYQQAGVSLPPPGTPVLNPVAPGDLQAGDVGVWKDHQVIALGSDKVLVSGQVQPESSIGSSPDFLGWMRPTQQATAQPAPPASTAAPTAPAPAPAAPVPVPAPQ
ncbi:hypothetical protein [Mycobacterium sp. SP-6446]|uniref:hypothetical protein n=1 Tax=Mycobacterium sp. SP-6446 TaxID=1834162 RepID=UPI001589EE0B|nr:hypothetical protein [Mycobacterium sp. SP-6446]